MRTVYHHVKFPEILKITPDIYYFCPNINCSIGYLSLSEKTIAKQHLRSYDDLSNNKLCYCFDVDTEQYSDALKDKTADPIKDFVIQKTKSGDCACEIKNPSGQCCLAHFKQQEKEYL